MKFFNGYLIVAFLFEWICEALLPSLKLEKPGFHDSSELLYMKSEVELGS
jgi:hypothetical protein